MESFCCKQWILPYFNLKAIEPAGTIAFQVWGLPLFFAIPAQWTALKQMRKKAIQTCTGEVMSATIANIMIYGLGHRTNWAIYTSE